MAADSTAVARNLRSVCFVGLENLPALSDAFDGFSVGGEQVQHALLARALAARGHRVSMVVADLGQADGAVIGGVPCFTAHGLTEGIPVLRFLHPRLTGLWAALKRSDSEVYYVSCAGPQIGIVALFAKLHGRRVIFRIAHDNDCHPERSMIRFWRDRKIYEYGLRQADRILAQSEQQAQALRAHYGLASLQATMLVEPARRMLGFGERDIDVLWVNNMRPFKRPDLAVELASMLPHLSFHMVGGALPDQERYYAQVRDAAGAVPNIRFHGRVPYHQVNALYDRARVFVNTSDSEGFPNSYLQSWRSGAPTVAFFDPDHVIERQALGRAVGSLQAMAQSVDHLATSAPAWLAARDRCLRHMREHYDEDHVIAAYVAAIEA